MRKLHELLCPLFLILTGTSADFNKGQGLRSRIIGGYEVVYHEYHYFAIVDVFVKDKKKKKMYQTHCGGTLIAKNVVMVSHFIYIEKYARHYT